MQGSENIKGEQIYYIPFSVITVQYHNRPDKRYKAVHDGRIAIEEYYRSCAHKHRRKNAADGNIYLPSPQKAAKSPHQEKDLKIIDDCACRIDREKEIGQVPKGNDTYP